MSRFPMIHEVPGRGRAAWLRSVGRAMFGVVSMFAAGIAFADEPVDFAREIRPILSDACFRCHGFSESSRKGDLRLDVRDAAVGTAENPGAVVPFHPEHSELLRRILSNDPDEQMPPPSANKPLSRRQIELLKRWIAEGAPYAGHWSFAPLSERPIEPTPPASIDRNNPEHSPIDASIRRELRNAKLKPSSEADRATLIRRVWLDLLGVLPPTADVDAFEQSDDPLAYERLLDRLLADPRFGERWGRHWLDQARYADSHGYTIDGPRVMWPFRDWVIWSLNADMGFDQFTIEQLAGDLLPNPSKSQLVATAFHRNTMINQEGGVKPDQFRAEAIFDRVNTTGAVWLGLTLTCAQCHTHKYDPISHREYFQIYSVFGNCADKNDEGPTVEVGRDEMRGWPEATYRSLARRAELKRQIAMRKDALKANAKSGKRWDWQAAPPIDVRSAGDVTLKVLDDGSVLNVDPPKPNDAYFAAVKSPLKSIRAVRLRALTHPSLPKQGPGLAGNGNFVLTEFQLDVDGQLLRFARATADHSQPDYPVDAAIDGMADTGWAINVGPAQTQGNPALKLNASHEAVFELDEPVVVEDKRVMFTLRHDKNRGYLIGRFAIDVAGDEASEKPKTETAAKDAAASIEKDDPELRRLQSELVTLERSLPGQGATVRQMVMRDVAEPEPCYRFERGEFLRPLVQEGAVPPGTPACLPPMLRDAGADSASGNRARLDFARWLVRDDQPLTPRVGVNRIWMRLFGRGIVETENDFGAQGTTPTHPDLLDWLARDWVRHNWSTKRLLRTLATSAVYRQSSRNRDDLDEVDPLNRLLGRQTRLRVDAEIVRDAALSAAGLLSDQIGGPGVFPPQPDGVYSFTQNKKEWKVSTGEDRYRRGLYIMFFRSAPYPLLTTFDSPDFSTVCTRRAASNTPLQSLMLANDASLFELAQSLGRETEQVRRTKEQSLNDALFALMRRLWARRPTSAELHWMSEYWTSQQAAFAKNPADAAVVAGANAAPGPNAVDAAAWTATVRTLFNSDEFITRE